MHEPTILQSSLFVHFFSFICLMYVDGKNSKAAREFKTEDVVPAQGALIFTGPATLMGWLKIKSGKAREKWLGILKWWSTGKHM